MCLSRLSALMSVSNIHFHLDNFPDSQQGCAKLAEQFVHFRKGMDDKPEVVEDFQDWMV